MATAPEERMITLPLDENHDSTEGWTIQPEHVTFVARMIRVLKSAFWANLIKLELQTHPYTVAHALTWIIILALTGLAGHAIVKQQRNRRRYSFQDDTEQMKTTPRQNEDSST